MANRNWYVHAFVGLVGLFVVQVGGCSATESGPSDDAPKQVDDADRVSEEGSGVREAEDSPVSSGVAVEQPGYEELKAAAGALDHALENDSSGPEVAKQFEAYVQKNDSYANLIGRIELGPDHELKFYEPQPGLRLYVEQMPLDGESALPKFSDGRFSFSELHEAVAPEEPVPETLLQADVRADDGSFIGLQNPAEFPEIRPDLNIDKHAGNCQHFLDHGGCPSASSGPCNADFPWCICDIDIDDTFQVAGWGTSSTWFVASVSGSVSIELIVNGNNLGIFAVPNGQHHGFGMTSPSGKGDLFCNCGTWQACATRTCHTWHFGQIMHFNPNEVYHFGGVLRRSTC